MGKEENLSSTAMGAMQILKEASKVCTKSWKSMLPVLLLALILSSLLFLGARFSTSPLVDLALDLHLLHTKDPAASPADHYKLLGDVEKDNKVSTCKELVFLAISFLTSWVSFMAAVYVHGAASAGRHLTPEELRRRMRGGWMGPLVTAPYIAILTMVYALFLETQILVLLTISNGSIGSVASGVLLASATRLVSFSLGVICGQGLAISMVDGGCYGVEALVRPVQLLRGLPASSSSPELTTV